MIVGDDGEFVGLEAVLPPYQEVAEVASGDERLRALERIDERDGLAIGYAEAPVGRARFASLTTCTDGGAEGRREDRLGVVLGVRGGEAAFDVLAGLIARIDRTGRLELRPDVAEPRQALLLHVRRVRATDVGAFGPLQSEPAEVFDGGIRELRTTPSRVEVFGAVEQGAGRGAGRGEGESAGVADVQVAGGRRG